jgi:hypothetical protein
MRKRELDQKKSKEYKEIAELQGAVDDRARDFRKEIMEKYKVLGTKQETETDDQKDKRSRMVGLCHGLKSGLTSSPWVITKEESSCWMSEEDQKKFDILETDYKDYVERNNRWNTGLPTSQSSQARNFPSCHAMSGFA